MSARPIRALALIAVLVGALVGALAQPRHAAACSIPGYLAAEDIAARLQQSDAVMVAEVVDETLVRNIPGTYPVYTSELRPVATLLGDVGQRIELEGLGRITADCSGGPRMTRGEHVLVFLQQRDSFGHPVEAWRVSNVGQGKYRLEAGQAIYDHSGTGEVPDEPAGDAEALLREIGRLAGSDPSAVEDAIAFALQPAPPRSLAAPASVAEGSDRTPVVAVAVGAGVATLLLVGWMARRRWGASR